MYPYQTTRKVGWAEFVAAPAEPTVYLLLWMVEKMPEEPLAPHDLLRDHVDQSLRPREEKCSPAPPESKLCSSFSLAIPCVSSSCRRGVHAMPAEVDTRF